VPGPFCSPLTAGKIKKSVNDSKHHDKSLVSGENVSLKNAWPVCKIVHGAGDQAVFSPKIMMQIKALACELPSKMGLPLSRFSYADIAREAMDEGLVASINDTTVWRWLNADAIKP